ncbi:hypothetical protein HDU87_002184 [Geranomyces variabilis]|uniref:Uncharacterized protein n=1 Tax=Geranomyces variabilis TaxID=109894 RepID=A0AAD5XNI0_9FUNG|nr:hypothetical protein HDU87_002184 [Geranomyces variabilis]
MHIPSFPLVVVSCMALIARAAVLPMPARLVDMTARQVVATPTLPVGVSGCAFTVGGELGDFFIPQFLANSTDAAARCASKAAQLAAVTIENFLSVSQGVYDCVGPNQSVSIDSWNGDSYAETNMTFITGSTSGPGAITAITPDLIGTPIKYLCQWTAPAPTK